MSRPIAAADLTAGSRHWLGLPRRASQRYVGVRYVLGGTTPSLTVTATVMPQAAFAPADPTYANAYAVSRGTAMAMQPRSTMSPAERFYPKYRYGRFIAPPWAGQLTPTPAAARTTEPWTGQVRSPAPVPLERLVAGSNPAGKA